MSERTHTVEIEAIGQVTFRILGELAVLRVRDAADRGAARGSSEAEEELRKMSPEAAQRCREDALLASDHVISPKLSDEEGKRAAAENPEWVSQIAAAIRERSWPNP